jgi:hypothetical protein
MMSFTSPELFFPSQTDFFKKTVCEVIVKHNHFTNRLENKNSVSLTFSHFLIVNKTSLSPPP